MENEPIGNAPVEIFRAAGGGPQNDKMARAATKASGSRSVFGLLHFPDVAGAQELVQVAGDLPVHLGEPVLAAGLGGGDDLQDLPAVLAVLGQEFGGGDEHRAGQAPLTELTSAFGHVTRLPCGRVASLSA